MKASYLPDGLQDVPVEKNTDTHSRCKDGAAVFNYRLKFQLSMPAESPRIKLQVYDYSIMGDNSLGETTLSIKNTINILNKHG